MKRKDELYLLVQSLDKSERRYFQLFAGLTRKSAQASYIELFNLLTGMKEWDPELFRKEVEAFHWKNNLSTIKTRLYDAILKSLRLLQEGKQPEARLRIMLEDLEILHQKGLYSALAKRLKRLEKLANEYQLPEILLQIQRWHRRIQLLDPPRQVLPEPWSEHEETLTALTTEAQLSMHHDHIRLLTRYRNSSFEDDGNQRIMDILEQPALKELAPKSSLRAKIRYYNANGLARLSLGNPVEALPYYTALFEFWEAHPEWIEADTEAYFSSLNNYFNCRLYVLDEALGPILDNLSMPNTLSHGQKIRFNRIRNSISMIYHLHFSDYLMVTQQIGQIEEWLNKHEDKIQANHWLSIVYNLATFHFVNDEFSKCNHWLLRIIGTKRSHLREDLRLGARLLQIVVRIQQGDYAIAENLIRSFLRKGASSDGEKPGYEIGIVQLIRQFLYSGDADSQRIALNNLNLRIEELRGQHSMKSMAGIQELYLWIRSQLENRKISAVLEEVRAS